MEKIIFFGTNHFAVPSLQKLAKIFDIGLVVTKPAKPVGRKKILSPSPIEIAAKSLKLNTVSPKKLEKNIVDKLKSLNPVLFVVVDYGIIIPQKILNIPKKGVVNIHPSELPKYRGASPIQTTILNGEKETAISIMLVDEEMDHGPILAQKKVQMLPSDTYESFYNKSGKLASNLIAKTIKGYLAGQIEPQEQNHRKATFTKLLKREDGKIDWNKSADEIERMVRAYDPWPGTFTVFNQNCHCKRGTHNAAIPSKRLKILKTSISSKSHSTKHPGHFFKTSNNKLAVSCGKNTALLIHTLQPEGKKPIIGEDFIRGYMKESSPPVIASPYSGAAIS